MKIIFYTLFLFADCNSKSPNVATSPTIYFGNPVSVTISGYTGDIMEPFLSADDDKLFFNNSNDPAVNTDIHWATRVNDSLFRYEGIVTGINTDSLEGVASMDANDDLYFISNRSYPQTLSTIYRATFHNGNGGNISLIRGVSKLRAGWINFDVDVNTKGTRLYFTDGKFDQNGGPHEANIAIAQKVNDTTFKRLPNSDEILQNINTSALEYAACISTDELELYFTRVVGTVSYPQIFVATRNDTSQSFGMPQPISVLNGFVEAPALSPSGNRLYFHKRIDNHFRLFMIRKE